MPRFKTDWSEYLHELRTRELTMVFGNCPAGCFEQGLELGAGDGFQSDLLLRYTQNLTVTDFYPRILDIPNTDRMTHQICDAQKVGEIFSDGRFDLVFSSNLLEHLPRVEQALEGIRKVLRDNGLSIHVVPSPFWKICQLALFAPDAVLSRLDRYSRGLRPR